MPITSIRCLAIAALVSVAGCASYSTPDWGNWGRTADDKTPSSELVVASGDNARSRRKEALVNSDIAPLAARNTGYYMDVQLARLRQKLPGTGIDIERNGDRITLMVPGGAIFATDSDRIEGDIEPALEGIARVLAEYRKTLVAIEGHTDSRGAEGHNQRLSERRALAVGRFLADTGIAPQRLVIIGYGESRPIADNDTEAGRNKNRRLELMLEPVVAD